MSITLFSSSISYTTRYAPTLIRQRLVDPFSFVQPGGLDLFQELLFLLGYDLQFQPVLPLLLTENLKLITRMSLPIIGGKPAFNPANMDFDNKSGLGDIALFSLFSPNKKPTKSHPYEILLGAGPTFIFPSASKDSLGQGKWQAGPTGLIGYLDRKWVIAALVQQWWSYGGDSDRSKSSQMAIQYFIWRNLPGAWQVGTGGPTININWEAPDNDDKVNLPHDIIIDNYNIKPYLFKDIPANKFVGLNK